MERLERQVASLQRRVNTLEAAARQEQNLTAIRQRLDEIADMKHGDGVYVSDYGTSTNTNAGGANDGHFEGSHARQTRWRLV